MAPLSRPVRIAGARACVNGITVSPDALGARARHNARSYITECKINDVAANDALHFGVDNLTLWQLHRSPTGRDSALIADISLRRIVVGPRGRRRAVYGNCIYETYLNFSLLFAFLHIDQPRGIWFIAKQSGVYLYTCTVRMQGSTSCINFHNYDWW